MTNLTDKCLFREDVNVDNHIIATYHLRHRAEEHKKVAAAIAIGQSIGNPDVRTERDSPKLLENHLAKIIYLEPQGSHRSEPTIAKIAYPLSNFGNEDGVTQLLCTLMGGQMDIDYIHTCRLADIQFPNSYLASYKGPKIGIKDIKKRTKAFDRPILGGIIKPKTGISVSELEKLVLELLEGGVDFIKEDEILGDPYCCRFKERVPKIADLVGNFSAKNGRDIFYVACINGDNYLERAEYASKSGASMVHLNFWAGLPAYKKLRDLDMENTGIFFQKSGDKVLTEEEHRYGINWPVICKLSRMMGVDVIHAGMWGGYLSDPKGELDDTLETLRGRNQYNGTLPSLSCGSHPGLVDTTVKNFGIDLMMNVGGAIQGHPMGTTAGAIAMRQAMAKPLDEDIKTYMSDKPELKAAIDKWGYVDPTKSQYNL